MRALALALLCACAQERSPAELDRALASRTPRAITLARELPIPLGTISVDALDARREVISSSVALSSILPARPTLVSFFATYCAPCLQEMPVFDELSREGYAVLGVSFDAGNLEELRATLRARGAGYPVAVVTAADLPRVGNALDGVPLTVAVDARGAVKAVLPRAAGRDELLELLAHAAR